METKKILLVFLVCVPYNSVSACDEYVALRARVFAGAGICIGVALGTELLQRYAMKKCLAVRDKDKCNKMLYKLDRIATIVKYSSLGVGVLGIGLGCLLCMRIACLDKYVRFHLHRDNGSYDILERHLEEDEHIDLDEPFKEYPYNSLYEIPDEQNPGKTLIDNVSILGLHGGIMSKDHIVYKRDIERCSIVRVTINNEFFEDDRPTYIFGKVCEQCSVPEDDRIFAKAVIGGRQFEERAFYLLCVHKKDETCDVFYLKRINP